MDKLFFAAFIIASSFVAGVSVFGLWLNARLYQTNRKARRPLVFIKTGFIITSAVLLQALISSGASPSTWRSWAYLLGVVVTGVGLGMVTLNDIEEVATESYKGQQKRMDSLEGRVTTEEKRNDVAERRADHAEERADRAEDRESGTGAE